VIEIWTGGEERFRVKNLFGPLGFQPFMLADKLPHSVSFVGYGSRHTLTVALEG
jgi:hypothetical protein